jgi:hypothetical protein
MSGNLLGTTRKGILHPYRSTDSALRPLALTAQPAQTTNPNHGDKRIGWVAEAVLRPYERGACQQEHDRAQRWQERQA